MTILSSQVDRDRIGLVQVLNWRHGLGFVMRWVNKVTGVCRGTGSIQPLGIQSFIEQIH